MKNKTNSFQPTLFGYRIDDTPHTPLKETSTPSKGSPSITKINSAKAYYSDLVQKIKPIQKDRVYMAIYELGEACDTDIEHYTGLKINVIPDRRGTLEREGLIEEAGNSLNSKTGQTVMYYKIKEI